MYSKYFSCSLKNNADKKTVAMYKVITALDLAHHHVFE